MKPKGATGDIHSYFADGGGIFIEIFENATAAKIKLKRRLQIIDKAG